MSNTSRIIQIPVLFDMSGSSLVFGEEAAGDFVDSHLQFLLDMTTEANGISLNASDISSSILIGDQDTGDNIFFDGDSKGIGIDNLCNRIAKAITRGKLVHIPSIGNFSNSGIPIGGEGHLYGLHGGKMPAGGYSKKYTTSMAPIGDEQMLGQAMARVASIHLIGDPLGSQAFEDAASIQTSLETASSQTFNQGRTAFYNALAVQLSKVLGGSKSSASLNPGIAVGTEKYSSDYNLTSRDQTYNEDGRINGSILPGQVYTSSSEYGSYYTRYAFDTRYDTAWVSKNDDFDATTGHYKGNGVLEGITGLIQNNNSWNGFSIKVDIGQTVVLSEYKIHPRHNTGTVKNTPREGYLVSSLDGINWEEIHHLNLDDTTGRLLYYDSGTYGSADTDLTGLNNREGRYFAFIFKKVFTGSDQSYGGIGELELLGVTKAEFDGGNPPTAYDVASSASTLNGQSYSSSHYYDTSWKALEAFDNQHANASAWLTPNGSFTQATGELISTYQTVTFGSGLNGEWIQVDLSQNINPGKFYLSSKDKQYPTEGYLLSSKDGNNWDIVHTLDSNIWNTHSTNRMHYEVDISGTPTGPEDIKIANHWRLAITKIVPTNDGDVLLYDFNFHGIVFPDDFGSIPNITNEIYIFNRSAYDFTSFDHNVTDTYTNSVISNQRYSASSYWNSSYRPNYAFRDSMDAYWRSANHLRYHTTTGLHNFSTWTGPYRGEYIQVDLSENFIASSYVIEGHRTTNNDRYNSPKKGYLLTSLDGKYWRLAHTFELSSNDASEFYTVEDGYKSIVNHTDKTHNCTGRYFRFVTEKLFPGCDGYVSLFNFKIIGVKESEANLGNGQNITTLINDYTSLVSPENLTRHAIGNSTYLNQNSPEPFPQSRFTASSYESNSYHPKHAFTQLSGDTSGWRSRAHYNSSTGTYYGTTLTDIYKGEWIQIDLSDNIFVDSYNLAGYYHSTESYHNASPKKGYLLSSLDGQTWRLVHTFDIAGDHADYTTDPSNNRGVINHKITNNENAIGKSWRFVVEKIFPASQTFAAIMNLALIGVKYPSQTIQGEVTKTTQDNTIYTLDVTPYPLTTYSEHSSYSTGSILTDNRYTGSSWASTSYYPKYAFKSYYTSEWRSYGQKYNSVDGDYYGPYMTDVYKGEWIQVDLSENVFADSYSIGGYYHTTESYHNQSPKKGYLLSSLDGKEWRLAHTFDIAGDHADYTVDPSNNYGIINHKITNNKNAIGKSWRFVVEKIFGGSTKTVIQQFVIYGGKETESTTGDGASNTQLKLYSTPTTAIDFTNGWSPSASYDTLIPRNHINQTFTASSYSTNTTTPKEAFGSYISTSNYWRSYGSEYNSVNGNYFGSQRTGDYPGEWIQVDLSENYFADNYAISGYLSSGNGNRNTSPKKGYLLSSLDGNKWRLAHTFDISGDHADYTYNETDKYGYATHDISNNSNAIGRYWRFVTEKVFPTNGGYVSLSNFTINGAKQTDIVEGNIVVDNSRNNVIYKLNATPYDLFNNFSELTGQVYSASTHGTTNAAYHIQNTFDGHDDDYKWYSMSQYNNVNGLYYGTKFTGPYHGEWIQVDLSENVFAGSYVISGRFTSTDSYHNSSPKKGYLLSSLDSKDWRLVHTFDISGNNADYAHHLINGYGYATHDISNNSNAIGRYWRFVTEKVFPGNGGYVWIGQFTVLGVKYPSEVTEGSGALTTTFINKIRTTATPYDLFNNFSKFTGQVYSASSHGTTNAAYQIQNTFDGHMDDYKWYSMSQYNNTSGTYYGTKFTGPYHGEWIQVDLSENVFAGSYVISGRFASTNSYHNSSPKKGYLLSSLDGKDWRLAHTFDIAGDHADYAHNTDDGYGYATHDISNNENAIGRYWRFVTEKVFPVNSGYVWIGQFTVLGVKYPSETIEGELVIDVSNNNSGYTLNATPYDLFNNFSKLTGQVYSASSHQSTNENYQIQNTFDGHMDDYKWHSKSQYNNASGTYYGTKFTGSYHGEWIQVDLSENVFAGSYVISGRLHTTDSYHNSAPKKGYLLSSLDGKDWRLAHTFDISGDDADYAHNTDDGYGYATHDISNNSNAIGRYWRFVTEKIFPGNSQYVWISQFTVLGVKYPSEITVSNLEIDPSLNITNVLPADMSSIYDLVTVNSTLTGQVYSASYDSNTNYPPSEAFDGILDQWENHWRGASQYNTNGSYYGTKFTGPYPGEWLQVDLSENVIIGEYEIYPPFHSGSSYYNKAPKKSYLLSSLDGKKWNLVHTHDVNNFSSSYGTYKDKVSYKLIGQNCKGRYFRLVTEKVFGGTYVAIRELIIKGVKEGESTIISQSLANSYNTFTNTTTPYNIYTRSLRHTTEPYLISSEKTTLISVDVSSPASTLTGQNYTASLGTANKAFDNNDATVWDISGNFKYNIFEALRTNEPNFTGWTLDANAGLLLSFSENVKSGTTSVDKNDFSISDNTQPNSKILSADISNGKVLLEIAKTFTYNDSVAEYDLASTSSTLMSHVDSQNRESIYTASSYYDGNYKPYEAFDATTVADNANNWLSANSSYANQLPVNNIVTTVDGNDLVGEWLQVEISELVIVKTFKYIPRTSTLESIQEAILAISQDGTTWTQIGSISRSIDEYTNTTQETYYTTSYSSGKYVRLICLKNWTGAPVAVGELTLLGQRESEATPIIITSHNNLKLTYTKNASKDKNIIGATNNVAVNNFSAVGGTLLNRGLYLTDSLATNEPNFTSSQVVGGKLEYTFSENLQAGTGGLDIADFQLIDNSGITIDISNNGTSINNGKLVIGTYQQLYTYIDDAYDLASENATHIHADKRVYTQARFRSGYDDEHLYDDSESTQWLGYEADYTSTHTNYIPEFNGIKPKNGFPQHNAPATLLTNMIATNNNSWNGDWLKVDMGETVVVSSITIHPTQHVHRTGSCAKQGAIISSDDGVSWNLVGSFSGLVLTDWYDGTNWFSKTFTVTGSSFRTARWIAVVFEKDFKGTAGAYYGNYFTLNELEIYGVTKTEQDGGSPPTPYNLGAYSRAGVRDRRYYASGQYHTNNNWNINEVFNGVTTGDNGWISVNGTHYDENGDYTGPSSIQSGVIKGDWVQVDMGINTLLSSFTIAFHSEMQTSAGRVVGSLDGESFTTIKEFKHTYEIDPSYVTINIDNTDRTEYRYYRLILENIYGYRRARIMKWMLNGYTKTHYYTGETINDIDYSLIYNKNASGTKNIIGATNSVAVNNFRIDNDYLISRGNTSNIGMYNGTTTTTLADTSTYTGEWIQLDIGENVFLDSHVITIPMGYTLLKSYLLLSCLDGSSWTKLYEVTDSNETLTFQSKKGRYVRLIISKIDTDIGFPSVAEFKINGTIIELEGQTYSASIDNSNANTVFNNSITTSWNTSSAYNYNGIDAAATNEATYSSVGLHTDASGNKKIELTFSADLSSNDIKGSDFTVTETDFSNTIPILADISGGKLLIEKQANIAGSVLYEDFNDQVITGPYATATFEQDGILNGNTFAHHIPKVFGFVNGATFNDNTSNYHNLTELNGKYYVSTKSQHIDEVDFTNWTLTRLTTDGRSDDDGAFLMFSHGSLLYIYGGSVKHTQLDSYNPATDTWTHNITTNGTAHPFEGGGYVKEGNILYVCGGRQSDNVTTLDLTTMTWATIDTTLGKILLTPYFIHNNRLYRYGGHLNEEGRDGNLRYLSLSNPSNGWTELTISDPNNLRTGGGSWFGGIPRGAKGVAVRDNKMYYVGGWDPYFSNYTDVLHYIDLTTNTVHEITPNGKWYWGWILRTTHLFIGDKLYLFGGGTITDGANGMVGRNGSSYGDTGGGWLNYTFIIDPTKTEADYGYRLKGEYTGNSATVSTKIWRTPTVTHKAVSFWHRFYTTDGTNNYSYIWSTYFDENDKTNSHIGVYLYSDELIWSVGSAAAGKMVRYYVDGVERTPVSTIHPYSHEGQSIPGTSNTGWNAYHATGWHFLYFEFNDDLQFSHFLSKCVEDVHDWGARGPIDSVRLYNTSISEAHIKEMYGGWDGMYPGASFDKTDYLIEYEKNSVPSHNIYDVNNTSAPINSFILRNGSLISRGTNYGHYSGSTTTTLADSSTSTGEYIDVNIGQQTYIISYELHVPSPNAHADNNVYPKSWILLGSADGSTWTKIHEVTDYAGWATSSHYNEGYKVSYMNEITNITAQYYRLIINKTYGKVGYTSVAELLINGVKHTSETTGVTLTKTASLGTAANAFDSNISTAWNTSSSATYGTLAATVTNEPIFSSGTINGSSQIELTFDTNIDISGTFNKVNLTVTNSSFTAQAYTASIDSGKLLLTYNPEQLPGLDTIFIETFDDQTTTDPLGDVGSIVAGGKDGLGYALQRNTSNQSHTGLCWDQTTLPENIKTICFWYIIDETDLTGTWNNLMWLYHNSSYTYVLRFASDNVLGQGTSHQGHQVEKYYIDGVLCGGANLVTSYDTDITEGGNPVTEESFQGTWRHIVLEFQNPLNDPNVTNSAVSKIRWLTEGSNGFSLKSRIDDIRFYDQALTQSQITTLATNSLVGTFSGSLSDYNIQYTKTNNGNLVNASHTSVDVNSFALIAGTITNRGSDGKGEYTGSTSTTLPDSSTYDGEWIQMDIGQTILMTSINLVVPNKDAYSNPKSWKLLISQDNTNWVEALDVSGNTSWDSGFALASTDYTGFQIGSGLSNQYIGRYFKVIVNSVIGPANHVKINEIVIKGVSHTLETQSVAGDQPILYTATESSNTTSQNTVVTSTTHNADDTTTTTVTETTVDISANTVTKTTTKETITTVVTGVSQPTVSASNNTSSNTDSTVTTTTHNADDTTITTVTETTFDIATNTVTTTTTKTTVTTAISAVTLNTATPSSTNTVHSDTTALTTTYNNNDTSVRTVVNKTIDISANTDTTTNLNTIITTTVTGFSVSSQAGTSFDPNRVFDASGVACPALKSIYEQLMNVPGRSQIMESQDFSTSPMPSVKSITGGFPFIAGDKLVMYIRPKIQFAQSTFPEQFTSLIGFGDKALGSPAVDIALVSGSGGGVSGQTYRKSSEFSGTYAVSKLFDGNAGSIWITASDTFNSSTQVAEEYYSGGHLFDDGGSRSLSLNHSLETLHEDFGNDNSTTTHTVTVGDNGGNKFKIDGAFNPILAFVKGNTYIFDQSDGTNSGHQIQISETSGGANTSYATTVGTPGTAGAKTTVVVPSNAPATLYYNCNAHGAGMGNSIGLTSQVSTGTVGAGVTYVTGHGGTGKALSTIGVSAGSPFIQSGINGSKAVSFWFYGDPTAANMNSTIMFDTRTNSGPNFALNYPDGVDYLHMWTGGSYTGIEGIYINGSLQTIDGAYSANYGSKIGGDNTTKASLSGVWTHIFVNFSPGVTTINDVTWLSRYTSGQVCPCYLDDVRWFAGALNDAEITNLSSGGSGNIGRNIINYIGHYAEIEFTESMSAETLKLTPRNGGGGGAGEPVDFRLLVLEDDNDPTWTSVLKVTESQIQPNWNKNGNDWATHEWLIPLSIGQGKYWRLVINKISSGNKVQLAKMELMGGLTSELTGGGDQAAALSIPGLETNVTNQSTTFPVLFPGNTTGGNEAEAQKFGWVGSANADSLSLETTDETDTRTMDLHIWKITITL